MCFPIYIWLPFEKYFNIATWYLYIYCIVMHQETGQEIHKKHDIYKQKTSAKLPLLHRHLCLLMRAAPASSCIANATFYS